MSFIIREGINWVGKIDWELKKFHGEEYSTHKGSSYNSYLIRDQKNVLIDTVWKPFAKEFVSNLKKEISLDEIDYIVINHGEVDHSGALPELMREIPDTPIYCTKQGASILKGHYHKDWNFVEVKTGDKLNIGSKDLIFIEAKMLHWPDTMFAYLTGDNILFSTDAFGQHYASEAMYNDLVDKSELYWEALKYYANILTPFSSLVKKKINELLAMDLQVDMICPSHGVIWRDNPSQIIEAYLRWASDYQENLVSIVYDSMWNATRRMAEAIAKGIKLSNPGITIKLFHTGHRDKNDVITEIFKSKAVLVGSSTINRGILTSIAAIIEEMRGMSFKNKKAAAFGSYGWGGEAVKIINEGLKSCGFELMDEGIRALWNPDDEVINKCVEFGSRIGRSLLGE